MREELFPIPFRMLFGNFLEIRGDKFDDVIESVADETFLVIHIYDEVSDLPKLPLLPNSSYFYVSEA